MKISDLHHLESISSETPIGVSGSAGVTVSVLGEAVGETTSTQASSRSFSISLPDGCSLALGIGQVVATGHIFLHLSKDSHSCFMLVKSSQ